MIGGISYGYFIAVPAALHFLMEFAGDAVTPNLTAESYLSFFLAYTGGLALLSLLPLLLIFWHWISPLTPGGLLKSERWIVVFAFVAAALVTPTPDVVNQAMIAGPVIGLYQLGVFAVLGAIGRSRKAAKAGERRKEVLRQVEERQARALKTQAAYLANATSNSLTREMITPDTTFAEAANVITISENLPAKAPARTSADIRAVPVNNSNGSTIHARRATNNVAQSRLRYAGVPARSHRTIPISSTARTSQPAYAPAMRQSYQISVVDTSEIQPQQA